MLTLSSHLFAHLCAVLVLAIAIIEPRADSAAVTIDGFVGSSNNVNSSNDGQNYSGRERNLNTLPQIKITGQTGLVALFLRLLFVLWV
eukprot:m.122171 g.122171  ORF g.122171 m.122171 type:complete len:88 (-) comp28905_c1_seq2:941-1204(-)